MKKFLIFCIFLFLGIVLFLQYNSLNTVQASYEEILQAAIERSSQNKGNDYEVIIISENFLDTSYASENQNLGENSNSHLGNNTTNIIGNTSDKNIRDGGNTSQGGNYGSPRIDGATTQYNDNCSGIFFDSCIVVSGFDSDEGPWKLVKSQTPIYSNTAEITNKYQK